MHVLIVDGEPSNRAPLEYELRDLGHQVKGAATGLDGLGLILADPPDIALLDLGVRDVDSFDLIKMLRAVSSVPVIALARKNTEEEVIRTLDLGADDYVVKPAVPVEIEARARAILRRRPRAHLQPVVVGGLCIDPAGHQVTLDGTPLVLTPAEHRILARLAQTPGQLVTKRELWESIGVNRGPGDRKRSVEVHLSKLRRKLGERAREPRYLRTERGRGVRLVPPRSREDVG